MLDRRAENRHLLICLFLAALVAAVFCRVPEFGFLTYDDNIYVTRNAYVMAGLTWKGVNWAFTNLEAGFWHPLTWLSLMLDRELYGMYAGGYHFTNVLLHLGSTWLLFLVLARMTGALWRSALVAALFAVHPLHVESVAWIAQRKDVLSTLFWMLTLLSYARYAENPGKFGYLTVLLVYALGLMAKPMLVTLPLVLLLLDWWPLDRLAVGGESIGKREIVVVKRSLLYLLKEKIPMIAMGGLAIAVTFYAENEIGALSSLQTISWEARIANVLISYLTYIGQTLWPRGLAVFYPYMETISWLQSGVSLFVLTFISILVFFNARRRPYLAVGWLWYLTTLVPVIGFVPIGAHARADRYTYLPLIGLFIMTAWIIPGEMKMLRRRLSWVAVGVVLGVLSFLAFIQTGYWRNDLTLFRHTLAVTEENYVAETLYATALMENGSFQEGMSHYQRAVAIKPNYEPAYFGMAAFFQKGGQYDNAIRCYRIFLAMDPGHVGAHQNIAAAYLATGQFPKAIDHYREALKRRSGDAGLYNNLGNALREDRQCPAAIAAYREAIRLDTGHAGAHNNLAMILLEAGDIRGAIRHFQRALELQPDYANAHYHLAVALEKEGSKEEARRHAEAAVRINPAYRRGYGDR